MKNVPAEELDLDPIICYKDTVPEREEGADVCAPPEEERSHTASRQLSFGSENKDLTH